MSKDKDNVLSLVPKSDAEIDAMLASIVKVRKTLPELAGYYENLAVSKRMKYDAFIEQKFTPEQALELCKGVTIL